MFGILGLKSNIKIKVKNNKNQSNSIKNQWKDHLKSIENQLNSIKNQYKFVKYNKNSNTNQLKLS